MKPRVKENTKPEREKKGWMEHELRGNRLF
jgi:hypothetical protein